MIVYQFFLILECVCYYQSLILNSKRSTINISKVSSNRNFEQRKRYSYHHSDNHLHSIINHQQRKEISIFQHFFSKSDEDGSSFQEDILSSNSLASSNIDHKRLVNKVISLVASISIGIGMPYTSLANSDMIIPNLNSVKTVINDAHSSWSSMELTSIPSMAKTLLKRSGGSGIPITFSLSEFVEEKLSAINQQQSQSKGWEQARQKRTIAIKSLQKQGFLSVDTDDVGNQFLSFPWIPDRKVPYKSLSIEQRLVNEVCAGAFGEISKDLLLHAVDTAKVRRQMSKNNNNNNVTTSVEMSVDNNNNNILELLSSKLNQVKELYSGFPVVLVTSIPQGGMFFFVKRGVTELLTIFTPNCPATLAAAIPIGLGVVGYWAIRTPAEVIKTQVQTLQSESVIVAIEEAKTKYPNGWLGLWKHYPVMLSLDIPFQVMNFILYSFVTDSVANFGVSPSIWSRLFCGATCGMVSAAITCPIDVCKTRIVARDKKNNNVNVNVNKIDDSNSDNNNQIIIETDNNSNDYYSYKNSSSLDYQEDLFDIIQPMNSTTTTTTTALSFAQEGFNNNNNNNNNAISLQQSSLVEVNNNNNNNNYNNNNINLAEESINDSIIFNNNNSSDNNNNNNKNNNVLVEMIKIFKEEGPSTLFLGFKQRLLYVGLANGIRLAAYGTSRMNLMMSELEEL